MPGMAPLRGINLFVETTVLALVRFNFIKQVLRSTSAPLSLRYHLIGTLPYSTGLPPCLYLLPLYSL